MTADAEYSGVQITESVLAVGGTPLARVSICYVKQRKYPVPIPRALFLPVPDPAFPPPWGIKKVRRLPAKYNPNIRSKFSWPANLSTPQYELGAPPPPCRVVKIRPAPKRANKQPILFKTPQISLLGQLTIVAAAKLEIYSQLRIRINPNTSFAISNGLKYRLQIGLGVIGINGSIGPTIIKRNYYKSAIKRQTLMSPPKWL